MKTSDFYYDLPKELIAQDPLEDRSSSRLLVLHRKSGRVEHRVFTDIVEYLKPGDCLVRNNTKVIPARLYGTRVDTGATIELLLLKRMENDVWETLVKPGKKARQGVVISFGDGILTGEIIDVKEDGNRLIQFRYEGIFEEILDQLGQMPLPPYITHTLKDKNRYQTVYAKYEGSAAAPTAGLHFTEELFQKLEEKGVLVANVTLHVGLGTFRPVKVDDVSKHHMHTDRPSPVPGPGFAHGLQGRRRGDFGRLQVEDPEKRETARIRQQVAHYLLGLRPRRDIIHSAARGRRHEPRQRSALHDHRRHRLP